MDPLSYIIGYKQGEANGGRSGDIKVIPITINENGLKIAPSGKAYSPISVNVENSYDVEDEGKVVSNGALVAQTTHAEISANGTYDTTLNDEVTVNVSGGGSAVIQPLSVTENGTYTPPSGVDGYAPVTVNVSGGGGGLSASIGQLFRYIMFSNATGDVVQRHDRSFTRTTNEPILFLPLIVFSEGVIAYTGYAGISFSSSGIAGTASSSGELTEITQHTTPSGTTYYVQRSSPYPPSVDNGTVKYQYGGTSNVFQYTPNTSDIYIERTAMDFGGNQTLVSLAVNLVDAMYQEYYAS